jgi:superfamily II DNA or RNA helicase
MRSLFQEEIRQLEPRPYQQNLVTKSLDILNQNKSVVMTAPTGAGKTIIIMMLSFYFLSLGEKVLIVVNRKDLLKQWGKELASFGIDYTIIQGTNKPDFSCSVAIASIQTLSNRTYDLTNLYDRCVTDECHNAIANSYDCLFAAFPGGRHLGVTATINVCGKYPKTHKLAGKSRRLRHRYDEVVWEIHPKDLCELGFLVPAVVKTYSIAETKRKAMKTNKLTGDYEISDARREFNCPEIHDLAIAEWKKHGSYKNGELKPAISFSCDVKHAKDMAAYFNQKGIPTVAITGNTAEDVREKAYADLVSGKIKCICSVGVISEGFNLPEVCVLICVRPTLSVLLWIQQSGRGLRIAPGKEVCIILDIADNALSLRHHPLDSVNIAALWREEDVVITHKLTGTEFEPISKEEKEKKEKQEKAVVQLKFLADYKDFETRMIDRLVAKRVSTMGCEKEYKQYWVYVSFVKTCLFPSKSAFSRLAQELGYQSGWAIHAHRKAIAYSYFIANNKTWKNFVNNKNEEDEIRNWAKPQDSYYSSSQNNHYSSQSNQHSSSGAKEEMNLNPKGDDFYPQLLRAYKKGGANGWEAVKSLFRKLALKLHPDHNPGMAHHKMTNLNLAFEKISNQLNKY